MARQSVRAKSLARRILPASTYQAAKRVAVTRKLLAAFRYDYARYKRFSSASDNQHNLRALITERYHSIEKGLSLPTPRPGFGQRPVGDLLGHLDQYIQRFGPDSFVQTVGSVLDAYLKFNVDHGLGESEIPHYRRIHETLARTGIGPKEAGATKIHRGEIEQAVTHVGLDFFLTRHSIRQYSLEPVQARDIEFAATAALKSPAVCNRQFGKIYAYTDAAAINRILDIQGGASGFGDQLSGLAVITTNLRSYWNEGQRNQAWIDGGLFAMSFILGLHARGIGTIALNWSKTPELDQRMRSATGISQEEAIVMLVGFGKLREEFAVASSPRQPLDAVLLINPTLPTSAATA